MLKQKDLTVWKTVRYKYQGERGQGKGNIQDGRQDKYKQRKIEMEHRKKNPGIEMCSTELQV